MLAKKLHEVIGGGICVPMSSVVWQCAAYAGPAARTGLRELFHTRYTQQNHNILP